MMILTIIRQDDGSFTVTDAFCLKTAKAMQTVLQRCCEEMELSAEDFEGCMENMEVCNATARIEALENTEGAERIEYAGELMDKEGLEAYRADLYRSSLQLMNLPRKRQRLKKHPNNIEIDISFHKYPKKTGCRSENISCKNLHGM